MAETRLNTCIEAMLAEFDRWHGSSDPLVDRAVHRAVFHLARGALKAANAEQEELRHALTEESALVRELGEKLAEVRDEVARVEALCDAEDERARRATEKYAERGIIEPKSGKPLRLVGIVSTNEVRAALSD